MRTMHLGPEELLVAVKIGVPAPASAADVAASIDAAERAMREAEPTAQVIYVEPDIYVEGHSTDPRPEPPAPAGALTAPARVRPARSSADAPPQVRLAGLS